MTAKRLPLTAQAIKARSTVQSYSKGQSYFRQGAIFDARQSNNTLEGYCEGSEPKPYHITITFDTQGIVLATCTCLYDWGGDCKHIVALLLTYLDKPDSFITQLPLEGQLNQRDKASLVQLIMQMVERYPDLRMLVDHPIPSSGTPRTTPLDTKSFRKELRHAIKTYEGWGDHSAENVIYSSVKTARQFAAKGDWQGASQICCAILDEALSENNYYFDDEGDYVVALSEVVNFLTECLNQPSIHDSDSERKAAIDILLTAFIWDVEMGGIGLGEEIDETLLSKAKPSDFAHIRQSIETAQAAQRQNPYGNWGMEAYANFLMDLDLLDNVDPEVVLKRLREQELYRLLFEKLLALGRAKEAIEVVEKHLTDTYERLRAVAELDKAGQVAESIRLAKATLDSNFEGRLAGWLLGQYQKQGDDSAYLQLLEQRMKRLPSEAHYIELQIAAEQQGKWQPLRTQIIQWLTQEQHLVVLTEVYLHDEEWDSAWATLQEATENKIATWEKQRLTWETAKRIRFARPQLAIPLYLQQVRTHIGYRKRDAYAVAAELLGEVKELYQNIGETAQFKTLLADLKQEFKHLPAFQDEVKKARL